MEKQLENLIQEAKNSKSSWTFLEILKYGFIVFLIFILTIGVPSVAVFLGIKFLPAMILWALSDGFWLVSLFCGCVPVLCTALASGILIGCFYGACALFRYLSRLSYAKNEALKSENPTRCNWLKRILALFGCIAFGLSTVIFPICVLVLVVDAVYIAVSLIVMAILILFGMAQGGGCGGYGECGRCDCDLRICDCGCDCSFLWQLSGAKPFCCCWKIVTTGENPIYKQYHELRSKCLEKVDKLLKGEAVEKHALDELLNNAKDINSSEIEELRSEIVKIILETKIIPLVVVLAIKQNKSVKKIFGLQIENQQQCTLNCKSFWTGVKKLLKSANENKQDNQINLDESSQLPSKAEIEKVNQTEGMDRDAAPPFQIEQRDRVIINDNNISTKTKHNIDVNCSDEDGKKLRTAWNSCAFSIEKYLNEAKNQHSLYENLIQEEKKQKENENEIVV